MKVLQSLFRRGVPRSPRIKGRDELVPPPFFIVGSGRCGTTLLRRLLVGQGTVHIPPETHVIPEIFACWQRNPNLRWGELVPYVLAKYEFNPEFAAGGVSLRPLLSNMMEAPPQQRSLAFLVSSIYRFHAASVSPGAVCCGDKTPLYVFHLDVISSLFPKARIVHMLRDPADVVSSMCNMKGKNYDVGTASERWGKAFRAFRGHRESHAGQCLELRYENLVEDPNSEVGRVCQFLEVDFDATRIEFFDSAALVDTRAYSHHANVSEKVTVRSVGKWRSVLSKDDSQLIDEKIGDEIVMSGYEPVAPRWERG